MEHNGEQSRKRATVGEGISAGSLSLYKARDYTEESLRRSKTRIAYLQRESRTPVEVHCSIQRPTAPKKRLWSPEDEAMKTASIHPHNPTMPKSTIPPQPSFPMANPAQSLFPASQEAPVILDWKPKPDFHNSRAQNEDPYKIIKQPETRPFSEEHLVTEVKGIYAGLVMVESKCIEVDNKQAISVQHDQIVQSEQFNNEQWHVLVNLHRTLIHEHCDLFLASQHQSASPALHQLASKYGRPARMWRHVIQYFLELLQHRLPVYLPYSMMGLLSETVPSFKNTWVECLGDLSRYRIAIEYDDTKDRDTWMGAAEHWYSKASDKFPTRGRLYHHLAILARPNALQQLFYYAKSICEVVPFTSARESILILLEPLLTCNNTGQETLQLPPLDTAFVKAYDVLLNDKNLKLHWLAVQELLILLNSQIGSVTRKFMERDYHVSITNCVEVLSFALKENNISKTTSPNDENWLTYLKHAQLLHNITLAIVLPRLGDPNVLPFIHCALVIMLRTLQHADAVDLLEDDFSWDLLTTMLNTRVAGVDLNQAQESVLAVPVNNEVRPLPEDYILRSALYADHYFSDTWFTAILDEEEQVRDKVRMLEQKKGLFCWLPRPNLSHHLQKAKAVIVDMVYQRYPLHTIFFRWIPVTSAAPSTRVPESQTKGLPLYFQGSWKHFTNELAGPLVFNTALVVIATMCYVCFTSRRLAYILPYAQGASSIFTFYAGFDDKLSSYQLAGCCIFTYILSHKYLNETTSKLSASRGIIKISITTMSLLLSLTTAYFSPTVDGRYSNWQVAGGIASLPVTSFLIWAWVTLFLDTGFAAKIESFLKQKADSEEARNRLTIANVG